MNLNTNNRGERYNIVEKSDKTNFSGIIDLHTHSTASDGSLSPVKLVRHARDKGLSAIALTDHDTTAGIAEAMDEGSRLGIEVLAGVEISVDFKTEMHILGYFPNGDISKISGILAELRINREERNIKTIEKLNQMGFVVTFEELAKLSLNGNIGRPHIAQVLTDKGYTESVRDAFDKYLANDKPAYFKKEKLTPEQGLKAIADAGGLPVLAHPIYLGMDETELDSLLTRLTKAGLVGMETYYTDNTQEQTESLLKLAAMHELAVTGGSDFHGNYKPDIEIGTGRGNLRIPYMLLERLKIRKKNAVYL